MYKICKKSEHKSIYHMCVNSSNHIYIFHSFHLRTPPFFQIFIIFILLSRRFPTKKREKMPISPRKPARAKKPPSSEPPPLQAAALLQLLLLLIVFHINRIEEQNHYRPAEFQNTNYSNCTWRAAGGGWAQRRPWWRG